MAKLKPLYDLSLINEDLRVRSMSMMAQLLLIKLMALANEANGMLALNGALLSPERAAGICGFNCAAAEFSEFFGEIIAMGLVEERGNAWCFPEMVAAAELRIKRQKAGSKGGKKSAGLGAEHSLEFCSSKPLSNVVRLEKTRAYAKQVGISAKKEPKKKKIINIYSPLHK